MKISERVLNDKGQFESFPERLLDRAVQTEARAPIQDSGEPDPNLPRKNLAKAEVLAKQLIQAKAKIEADKLKAIQKKKK